MEQLWKKIGQTDISKLIKQQYKIYRENHIPSTKIFGNVRYVQKQGFTH